MPKKHAEASSAEHGLRAENGAGPSSRQQSQRPKMLRELRGLMREGEEGGPVMLHKRPHVQSGHRDKHLHK